MGIMDEFFSMGLALKTQFVRMGRHRVFADLAQELDLNLKYPAHIFGDVGDVWIAVRIDMQKNGDAPTQKTTRTDRSSAAVNQNTQTKRCEKGKQRSWQKQAPFLRLKEG